MAKSFALGIYILRRSAMFISKMLWSRFNTIVINTIFIPVIPGVVFKNDNIGIKLIISASLSLIILFIR
jgi:hypothetical protein